MNTSEAESGRAAAPAPGGPEAATPLARRPLAPKKVEYRGSWMRFLAALLLLLAWWFPVNLLITRLLWPRTKATGPRDATAFVALGYEGVSTKETEVAPARFRDHIVALKAAGYVPITLRDVEDLMYKGLPLPRKAVLVTFDQSRRTSYFDTHTILRRNGWSAVMFLWTRPILDGDPAALLWPYIRNMLRSGIWEIGAQSYDGFRRIPASARGHVGNFMTSPMWMAGEQRYETLEEFQHRIAADHDACLAEIERRLGQRPNAYAFPYGDFGQYQHRATITRPINLGLLAQRYRLGFILGNLALNTQHSDPRRLNRLLVRPEWSGRDLVERLDRSWPDGSRVLERDGVPFAAAWITDWGQMTQERDGSLLLFAATNATGAKMWMAGSDMSRDFNMRLRFRLEGGQLGLYLRASSDDESYVYLGLDPGGAMWLRQMAKGQDRLPVDEDADSAGVWLRQKFVNAEKFTLSSARISIDPGKEHQLEVSLRNRLLFARLDGREVFQSRGMLRGEVRPGMVGVSVWASQPGVARTRILGVEVRNLTPVLASLSPAVHHEPFAFRWIYQNAYRLTDLCPVWDEGPDSWPASPRELEVYRLLARVNHLQLRPQFIVRDEQSLHRYAPGLLADKAAQNGFDGLFVNMGEAREIPVPKLAQWLRQCAEALATNRIQWFVKLPATIESRARLSSLLAVAPGVQVAVDKTSPLATGAVGVAGGVARVENVPEPAGADDLPFFYMIPSAGSKAVIETPEARTSRIEQEGMAAYLDGQYDRAVELWREWQSIEPENPKAFMLVGDALARKGDLRGAVAEYDRSLDLDPGQIPLAVRRAGILTAMGEADKAMESLNLYARLFPGNASILLAQARWLSENNRSDEAVQAARKLLAVEPANVEGLAMLLRLTNDPEEYRSAMARLAEAAVKPDNFLPFAQAAWRHELTAMPNAGALLAALREVDACNKDPRIAELCARLLPNVQPAVENLATERLSSRWWVDGGAVTARDGRARLQAADSYSEASMRLLGSLHVRDAVVEAEVGGLAGSLWLYGRRTARHLVRFGVSEGTLYLQAWRGGRLVQELKREWEFSGERARFRLEIHGNSATGFIDGEPAFTTRMIVPRQVGAGWAGLAVYAAERGRAGVDLYRIVAGSTGPRLAVVPPTATSEESDATLAEVRSDVARLSALCPAWHAVDADGRWTSNRPADAHIFRIFSRYHRLLLLPFVECRSTLGVVPSDIEARAQDCKVDGFVLAFKEWPGDDWVESFAQRMSNSALHLLVLAVNPDGRTARARLLGAMGDGDVSAPVIELRVARRTAVQFAEDLADFQGFMIGY